MLEANLEIVDSFVLDQLKAEVEQLAATASVHLIWLQASYRVPVQFVGGDRAGVAERRVPVHE